MRFLLRFAIKLILTLTKKSFWFKLRKY